MVTRHLARIAHRHTGRGELDPYQHALTHDLDPDDVLDAFVEANLPREDHPMTTPASRGRANRARGARHERELVAWLRTHGFPYAERTTAGMYDAQPAGDVDGLPGVHLEARNRARLDLAAWVDEVVEAAGARLPVVVVRRRGTADRGRDYAVLPLDRLTALLRDEPPTPRPRQETPRAPHRP